MESEAFLSKDTGAIYCHSEYSDDLDELPSDIDEGDKYLAIPHKNDLELGKRLALRFAEEFLPDDLGKVREIFSRRGAYARYKDLLEARGALSRWYDYEASAQKQALREWCSVHGVEIDG
jgi:hypothetical protein